MRVSIVVIVAALFLTGCPDQGVVCGEGLQTCGDECVDVTRTRQHCGACGVVCGAGQACSNSQCINCPDGVCPYDVIAACSSTGHLVGISDTSSDIREPVAFGSKPAALAVAGDTLLVADQGDQMLRQTTVGLQKTDAEHAVGKVSNQLFVAAPFIYVVNAGSGTLQSFRIEGAQSAPFDLKPVEKGVHFGANSFPEAIAKLGSSLFVPLFGSTESGAGGGKVVEVDVSDPENPHIVHDYNLNTLDLKPNEGFATIPRAYSATRLGDHVFVGLSNLTTGWAPEGPAMLVKINPQSREVTPLYLGSDVCLNVQWVAPAGENLLVSCGGKPVYDEDWNTIANDKSGLLLVDRDGNRLSSWTAACPAELEECTPPMMGRFTLFDQRIYVTDQSEGRVFRVDIEGGQLVEKRGYGTAAGPLLVCGKSAQGFSNVSDVVAVPR